MIPSQGKGTRSSKLKESKDGKEGKEGDKEKEERKGDLKQTNIDKIYKKVSYNLVEEKEREDLKELKNWVKEELKEMEYIIKEEMKRVSIKEVELDKWKAEMKEKDIDNSEKLERIINRLEKIEEREAEWETRFLKSIEGSVITSEGGKGSNWSVCETDGGKSHVSAVSAFSKASGWSIWSEKDTVRMKQLLMERERKAREDNIIIKGVSVDGRKLEDWAKDLLQQRLKVSVNIKAAWKAGNCVVVKLNRVEEKK